MTSKMKRFYKKADVVATTNGFVVELDGRPIKSPGRHRLVVPDEDFARGLATEWRQQGDTIDEATMPVMRFAGKVADQILPSPDTAQAEIAKYACSDLLCYRAGHPDVLVERQRDQWDPVLAHFKRELNIEFSVTCDISYIEQSAVDMQRFEQLVHTIQGYRLGAAYEVTMMTGSAILALAFHLGWLSRDKVWQIAHIDEDFQAEQWGQDSEARENRQRRHAEFCAAALVYPF